MTSNSNIDNKGVQRHQELLTQTYNVHDIKQFHSQDAHMVTSILLTWSDVSRSFEWYSNPSAVVHPFWLTSGR